jgi:hypothetical protein
MSRPVLSVVLAAAGDGSAIRRTLDHLRAQTACDRLEVVIVSANPDSLALGDDDLAVFAGHLIVGLDRLSSKAQANAAGIRAATAGVVAMAEDHSFAEPGWARALIERHAGGWAAVGPLIRNANPATRVSWCDLLLNYAPWLESGKTGPVGYLPGHNTSYKTPVLLRYEERLVDLLEVETELHDDMRERGETLFLESEARVAHVNFSRVAPWLETLFLSGRIYAAARRLEWSVARRLAYALLWPLIPIVRLKRILGEWPGKASGMPGRVRLIPTLLLGLVLDGAGQATGYLMGAGESTARMLPFEFERERHVVAREHALLRGA